jgi:tetratricopeptide (TPR) repeat protein
MDPLQPLSSPTGPAKVEQLVRDAKIAAMRGDHKQEMALVEEALVLAPKSPGVLEAKGDALMAMGRKGEAKEAYKRGLELAPGHNNLEAKYAELILGQVPLVNPEMITSNDVGTFASGKMASLISVFMPGLGHIILGQTVKGACLMGGMVLALILCTSVGGFAAFLSLFRNFQDISGVGVFVLVGTLFFYVFIQFDVAAVAKRLVPPKYSRPIPPVDKPF